MFEEIKALLVEEMSIDESEITENSEFVKDLGFNSLEIADLVVMCEERFDVEEDEYMEMIFKKTGALIAAATKAGAIMGGASDEVIDAMYEYGRLIGLAFQIQDDYLDIAADEETLGKPIGSDIGKGKMTIIAIKGLASVEDGRLLEILKAGENSQDEIDEAVEILTDCGAIEYARNLALESVDKAKEVLEILDDSSSKQVLVDIADFVLERSA